MLLQSIGCNNREIYDFFNKIKLLQCSKQTFLILLIDWKLRLYSKIFTYKKDRLIKTINLSFSF